MGKIYCINIAKGYSIGVCFVVLLSTSGCKKLVTVDPPVSDITSSNVFSSNTTAAAVLTGIYANMSRSSFVSGSNDITLLTGLSSDELTLFNGTTGTDLYYYVNGLTSLNVEGSDPWSNIYPIIYVANSAIVGLKDNQLITASVQQQLMGEALFIRAFCYFYLVNMYGDVPLVTGTNYTVNDTISRASKVIVWQQIISDLRAAQGLLSPNFLTYDAETGTSERTRPTKWAAAALLARSYLYTQQWDSAIASATEVIDNSGQFSLTSLDSVFLKNGTEAIWQLQPVNSGTTNTFDAYQFILPSSGPTIYLQSVYISPFLLNSYEAGDLRRYAWIDSVIANGYTYYYPYKYKVNQQNAPVTEYIMMLRLGEQYLIRAEGEAELGELSSSEEDLDIIRARAGLAAIAVNSRGGLLAKIYHERQIELFTELGHRWFDLKRTSMVDSVMGSPENVCNLKGGEWNTEWSLYPISLSEIQKDPYLIQNPGYQ